MMISNILNRAPVASAIAISIALAMSSASAAQAKSAKAKAMTRAVVAKHVAPARPAPGTYKPSGETLMTVGRGQLINLPSPITDVFISNDQVADVQVKSPTQIYLFAKKSGETTIYATNSSGNVVYSSNIRAGENLTSIDQMLKLAMPESNIQSTTMNGLVLLTGTVRSPDDAAEAERLVQAFVGDQTKVLSRLRAATPLQVNLQVKIAEVSRTLVKEFGANLATRDNTNGFQFGLAQGRTVGSIGNASVAGLPTLDASTALGFPPGTISLPYNPQTGQFIYPNSGSSYAFNALAQGAGRTAVGMAGKLFGLDVMAALDFAESEGLLSTLAQPNLTALSGETASFLAGGEIPIPLATGLGQVSVEYKQYGVSLAFTPIVLEGGRISMRVRPEVSELTTEGAVRLNGFAVPSVSTRRAETTVELGSGQSFMIAGLMRNNHNGTVDRTPGAGDVPVLGALFRSQSFRNNQTELVIIVTPYLVKPVNANEIALPTDGFRDSTDVERILLGKLESSKSGTPRPVPTMAPPAQTVGPAVQGAALRPPSRGKRERTSAAAPGFSGN